MKKLPYSLFFLCCCFSFPSTASKRDKNGRKPIGSAVSSPAGPSTAAPKAPKGASAKQKPPGGGGPDDEKTNSSGRTGSFDLSAFKKMLRILDREDVTSEKYKRAARDLEASYYHNSSFETLELLSDTYKEKGDKRNQIKVLERIVLQYPDDVRGHYLLGMVYKNKYDRSKELEKDRCQIKYSKTEDENNRLSAIEALSSAIKKDPKHEPSYLALLPLLREAERVKDPSQGAGPEGAKTKAKGKTLQKTEDLFAGTSGSEVLNLVKDMVRYFRKPEYYVDLCEAYYSNGFPFGQVRRACRLARKKQPENPTAHLHLALARAPGRVEPRLMETAGRFPRSEMIQNYTAEWFLDKNSDLAVKYFSAVTAINPKNAKAHRRLAGLFLKAKSFEKAFKSFKTACLLDFKYIKDFEKAKEKLFYSAEGETQKKLLALYESGIDECWEHFKKHKSCPEN